MHCLGFSLSVPCCHAYAYLSPPVEALPPHASSAHCGLSSGPHARRHGTGGKGESEAEAQRGGGCRSCSGSSATQSARAGARIARPRGAARHGTLLFARRVRWRGAERHVASCLAPCSPAPGGPRTYARAPAPAMAVLSSIFSSHEVDVSRPWGPGLDATRPALAVCH